MTQSFFEIPEYHRYLSPTYARTLLRGSQAIPGVPGLTALGDSRGLESPASFQFLVDLYEELKPRLGAVLRQRVLDREFIDERTRACFAFNKEWGLEISDPEYLTVIGLQDSSGRTVIGPKSAGYARRGGAPIAPIPPHLQGSHVTLFGPPDSAKLAINAMNAYHRKLPGEPPVVAELLAQLPPEAASPKWGADDEDSKTPLRRDLVDAAVNLKGCFEGTLRVEEPGRPRTYELAPDHRALPIKRFPGLALPCSFLFLRESPIPLHLYDFALHVFEHWHRPEALTFYVPKLENEEEAAYIHAMVSAAERRLKALHPSYTLGTVRLMVVLENPRAILRTHEIMDALHPYFVGASLGWHDYLGSTARLFKEDGNYRIPVKADPDIVIKYIQASHRLVADVVGSRGGIKVGGMYGILPVTTDLQSESFQVTLLGFFKDVITQLKRDLTGFWVAHPDFVRLGLALVQAWKLRTEGNPEPLTRLCTGILRAGFASEIEAFISGPDIKGLNVEDPGYVRSLLVADLRESDTIPNHDLEEVRYNVFQALQYLVDWLSGNGCVALPALVRGTPVRVMDDLATAERSRWEVWHEIRHGRVARQDFLRIAFEELQFIRKDLSDSKKIVQVKWDARTAKWYPVAFHLMLQLMTAEEPVEFATELLLPFTEPSIRETTNPLLAMQSLDPQKYSLPEGITRFCRAFEACASVRFASTVAASPVYDALLGRACIQSFTKAEVIEAANFHGDIGEPKKFLDARAATEQAGVSDGEREVLERLRKIGAEYRRKFGFKFLISAQGRSGAELLSALESRALRQEDEELQAAKQALWEIAEKRFQVHPVDCVQSRIQAIQKKQGVRAVAVAVARAGHVQELSLGSEGIRFELASLSKTLATAFALEFFRTRQIPLSTSVNSLFAQTRSDFRLTSREPGIDPNAVTLAHLVNHQALNQHYVNGISLEDEMPSARELLASLSVINPPGTRFQYSGGGFLVLEHLIQSLSGKNTDAATQAFLEQLEAPTLTFNSHRPPPGTNADGYFDTGEKVPGGRLAFPAFAAGALGTAKDTLRFLEHLRTAYRCTEGSGPVSHDTAIAMLSSVDLGCRDFMGCEIGLGVFVIEAGPNRLMLHQGANEGFRALFLHCFDGPNTGDGLVAFCNADQSGVGFVAQVAQELLKHFKMAGVDFNEFRLPGELDSVPKEQRVNLGYRDWVFRAFQPMLPEPIVERGPQDPLATFNCALGASLLRVSNQRFARAENLLSGHLPVFDPRLYGKQGKIMDSWESARHNTSGVEFLECRLPRASRLKFVSFSTEFHDGNHSEFVRLLGREGSAGSWEEFLPRTLLKGHSLLELKLPSPSKEFSEIRVEMGPDGGLSRLGLYAELPVGETERFQPPDLAEARRFQTEIPKPAKPLTLPFEKLPTRARPPRDERQWNWASLAFGGQILRASNEHYGPAHQVLSPFPPLHMFDGFESSRSRVAGHHEELEFELGHSIHIERVVLDFSYFVNNNPREIRLLGQQNQEWVEIISNTPVKAFAANRKEWHLQPGAPFRKLKLEVYPDGGINRIAVYGKKSVSTKFPN